MGQDVDFTVELISLALPIRLSRHLLNHCGLNRQERFRAQAPEGMSHRDMAHNQQHEPKRAMKPQILIQYNGTSKHTLNKVNYCSLPGQPTGITCYYH